MTSPPRPDTQANRLRAARVGDVLPSSVVAPASARGIESAAVLQPGLEPLDDYLAQLKDAESKFAEWDGRLLVAQGDGQIAHRLLIVDRYGQVYQATDAPDAAALPSATDLTEWFKFLATACPECGVLDDPTDRDWVP